MDCPDPTAEMTNRNQLFGSGPSAPFNYTAGAIFYLQCSEGYKWITGLNPQYMICASPLWIYQAACAGKS